MGSAPDFIQILKVLSRHKVEYILVGGLAAIVQGAPVFTFDLDIVFLKTAENLPRLAEPIDAVLFYADFASSVNVPCLGGKHDGGDPRRFRLIRHRIRVDVGARALPRRGTLTEAPRPEGAKGLIRVREAAYPGGAWGLLGRPGVGEAALRLTGGRSGSASPPSSVQDVGVDFVVRLQRGSIS